MRPGADFYDWIGEGGGTVKDGQIVELYWARDERALAETEAKYGGYCLAIARNILSDGADAEECVNDTWLGAWNAMPDARPSALSAFLGKITRRLALDRWRAKYAAKRGGGETPLVLDELAECAPAGEGPEEALAARELAEAVNAFLRSLPPVEMGVFLRRYWYLESVKDTAARLGFSQSKVKSMLARTRKKLRTYLEKEGLL